MDFIANCQKEKKTFLRFVIISFAAEFSKNTFLGGFPNSMVVIGMFVSQPQNSPKYSSVNHRYAYTPGKKHDWLENQTI